jgi:flavin-dependent dehydrogenase
MNLKVSIMPKKMVDYDVFIVGAGTAGCSAALNLARFCRVLMIDRQANPLPRVGESLLPAANKLLTDMGLMETFVQQGFLPCYGNQSRWGSEVVQETDFLRDPAGHGWHLDRQQWEIWLRATAIARGATLIAPARLERMEWAGTYWNVSISYNQQLTTYKVRCLIDAGGRTPVLAKRLGAIRTITDDLVCHWIRGCDEGNDIRNGLSYIESEAKGWWYTAPIPHQQRIISFHTLAKTGFMDKNQTVSSFLEAASCIQGLNERIDFQQFIKNPNQLIQGYTAAQSAAIRPVVGEQWLAIGDAALSFDPLAAQGIFNALYTGLAAAECIYQFLSGNSQDFSEYEQLIDSIGTAYQIHLKQWYGAEMRWEKEPFWNRFD